jgi:hypothetical protein
MTSSGLGPSCGNLSLYCWQRALMCIVVELSFVMLLAAVMTGACDTKLTLFISRLEILLPFYVLLPHLYIRHSTFCARSSVSRRITTSQIQMYLLIKLATLDSHCCNGKCLTQQYTSNIEAWWARFMMKLNSRLKYCCTTITLLRNYFSFILVNTYLLKNEDWIFTSRVLYFVCSVNIMCVELSLWKSVKHLC